jgi:Cu/Ag efflux protein CusF
LKNAALRIAALAMAATLSACGQDASPTGDEPTVATTSEAATDKMAMPAETRMAKGTGTVTAVDAAAGTITLDHGAMPEVEWPAMTMAFSAKSELLTDIKVGDNVNFDVSITGNAGEITSIRRE